MEIERICNFCNEKFITNSRKYGIIYNNKRIHVCKKCMIITKKCSFCGKEVKIKFTSKDKNIFCSLECVHKNMKKNKIGIYNPKVQKIAHETSHTKEACNKRSKIMKNNESGIYNTEVRAKGHKIIKEKGLGAFDSKVRKIAQKNAHIPEVDKHRTQINIKNKIGIYNPKVQKIAHEKIKTIFKLKIKNLLSSIIINDLFLGDSFDKIIPVSYDSFSEYNNVPGIWAIYGENLDRIKVCLDVCQTKDIGNEMRYGMRKLIKHTNSKYKEFIKYKNIFFILVKTNILNFEKRELIEAIYAVENNSLFWSTSPTQLKYIKSDINELYKKLIKLDEVIISKNNIKKEN